MATPKIVGNPIAEEIICRLHTQGYSERKIVAELEISDIHVSQQAVHQFLVAHSNQPTIQKLREQYLTNPKAVPIFHKRIRLEDLNRERVRIIRTIERLCDKSEYVPLKSLKTYLLLTKRLVDIEIAGREEVEKRPDMVAMFQRIGPLAEVTDAELLKECRQIETKIIAIRSGKTLVPEKSPTGARV